MQVGYWGVFPINTYLMDGRRSLDMEEEFKYSVLMRAQLCGLPELSL